MKTRFREIILIPFILIGCSIQENQDINKISELIDQGLRSWNHELVLENADELIKIQPTNEYGFYYKGIAYKRKNELKNSIENLNKAIELNNEFCEAYYLRGLIKAKLYDKIKSEHENKEKLSDLNNKDLYKEASKDIQKAIDFGCEIDLEELFFHGIQIKENKVIF